VLAREESWREALLSFVDGLGTKFPMYRDVLQPLAISVYQMVHGASLLADMVRCTQQPMAAHDLALAVTGLVSFPACRGGCVPFRSVCKAFFFSSCTDRLHGMACDRFESPAVSPEHVQEALEHTMRVARAISGAGASHAGDARLPIQALRVALGRAYLQIQAAGRIGPAGLGLLGAVFDAMAGIWSEAEACHLAAWTERK
jgi:hypothetical protein